MESKKPSSSLFPTKTNQVSLFPKAAVAAYKPQVDTSFLSSGSSFKPQTEEKQSNSQQKKKYSSSESESDSSSSSSSSYRRRRRDKKKKKKRKDKKRSRDSDSSDEDRRRDKKKRRKEKKSEKEKILEFEKKRIRIDPRSTVDLSGPRTLWAENNSLDKVYEVDLHGDPNNALFGALYRSDIPAYTRYNNENPFHQQVLKWRRKAKEYKKESQIYMRGVGITTQSDETEEATPDRYWRGKLSSKGADSKMKRVVIQKIEPQKSLSGNVDFIPLEAVEDEPEDTMDSEQKLMELKQTEEQVRNQILVDYDEDEPWRKYQEQEDQLARDLEESNRLEGESFEESIVKKTREFNEKTRADPYNIELWLDYVKFQEQFAKLQKRKNPTAIIEKKLGIYERALESNPTNAALLSGYLRESREILSPERLEESWRKSLAKVPDSLRLWTEYFMFKRSVFSHFSVGSMRNTFSIALKALAYQKRKAITIEKRYEIEETMINIFYEACTLEKRSGYTERSIALFQAMLELSLFGDPSNWELQLTAFKDFWESEAPRIGEEGAEGWSAWIQNIRMSSSKRPQGASVTIRNDDADVSDNDDDDDDDDEEDLIDTIKSKEPLLTWMKEDERRSLNQWQPCRATKDAEIVEKFPERIVLWEDVQNYLFPISFDALQLRLIMLFLEFMGISVLYTQQSVNDMMVHESLCEKDDSKHLLGVFDAFNSQQTSDVFQWKPSIPKMQESKRQFIKNVLAKAIQLFPDEKALAMSYLEFESQSNTETTRMIAKSLLKEDSSNLVLWNYYAQLEYKSNNIEETKRIYDTCLSLVHKASSTKTNELVDGSILIFRSFAELEIEHGNLQNATHILCSCAEAVESITTAYTPLYNEPSSTNSTSSSSSSSSNTVLADQSIRVLRARKIFDQKLQILEQLLKEKKHQDQYFKYLEFVMCAALLEHVSKGPLKACEVFERMLMQNSKEWPSIPNQRAHYVFSLETRTELFQSRKAIERLLLGDVHEQYLWLLYLKFIENHIHSPKREQQKYIHFSRSRYRDILSKFLTRFPTHPVGLALLIQLEQQVAVTTRLRRFFDNALARVPSPVIFLFAIYTELQRQTSFSENRIRSLFETAFEYQICRSNVMLWRFYIRFEISQGDYENAKRIFYRAIDKCPHAKTLWMDSFKLFSDRISVQDIKDQLDLILEKEVMLRSSIEEFVESEIGSLRVKR